MVQLHPAHQQVVVERRLRPHDRGRLAIGHDGVERHVIHPHARPPVNVDHDAEHVRLFADGELPGHERPARPGGRVGQPATAAGALQIIRQCSREDRAAGWGVVSLHPGAEADLAPDRELPADPHVLRYLHGVGVGGVVQAQARFPAVLLGLVPRPRAGPLPPPVLLHLSPAEQVAPRRTLELAVDQERPRAQRHVGPEVRHLAVGEAIRRHHRVIGAWVALEGRQVVVIDVVEHGGPLVGRFAVAVILQADKMVEALVGLFEAGHEVALQLAALLALSLKLPGEGLRHPQAGPRRVAVGGAVAPREVAADDLVVLHDLDAAPTDGRRHVAVPPVNRPWVARAQARGCAAPEPAPVPLVDLPVARQDGVRGADTREALPVVPLEAAVRLLVERQGPVVARGPEEVVAAMPARPGL